MPRSPRATKIEAKLEALKALRKGMSNQAPDLTVAECLRDSNWLVVAEACETVSRLGLRQCEDAVRAVWARFVDNAPKRDPGCRAKLAALTALDQLEILDPDPFLRAIRHRQLEPAMGGKIDTAGETRVRCLMALLRMLHSKAALYAGELLADADSQVRAGVVKAIGHYSDPKATALLAHKLRSGDPEPEVLLEAALALLAVDSEFGLGLLVPWLSEADDTRRETAAMALGQCRNSRATQELLEWAESGIGDTDHYLVIRSLGLSRDLRARQYLLEIIESGPNGRARAAVEALAVHRYDSQLLEMLRKSVSNRSDRDLDTFARRALGEP